MDEYVAKKLQVQQGRARQGSVRSFMDTLDMSLNGRYSFDIKVEGDKTTAVFKFTSGI